MSIKSVFNNVVKVVKNEAKYVAKEVNIGVKNVIADPIKNAVKDTIGIGTGSGAALSYAQNKNNKVTTGNNISSTVKGAIQGTIMEVGARAMVNSATNVLSKNSDYHQYVQKQFNEDVNKIKKFIGNLF